MTAASASAGGDSPWRGRSVLVGVSGGIAAYKTVTVVSRLVQGGATVRVLMTEAATRFVTPLTFAAISGSAVGTSIWEAHDRPDSQHIAFARSAQLMIIAPATADLIAKLAAGICDDVVSLVACALPRTTPVLLAPAMNEQMWQNPIVQRNVATVRDALGYHTIGPASGWQACRTAGAGRMSEPDEIVTAAAALVTPSQG